MADRHPTFDAHAFKPGLGNEVVAGKIVLDRWRLRFESASYTLEIPLPQLQIELTEENDERIYFRDPNQPGWAICTADSRILEGGPLLQNAHTRSQIQETLSRVELKRRLMITLGFLAGFAFLALIGSLLVGVMVRSLVAKVPAQWETGLGDSLMAELRKKETFVGDPKSKAKLDRAVAPLVAAVPSGGVPFKFYILEEPLPNAFALPGGYVMVTRGLLDLAERPEEIAGVVAHELAHVTQKHGFRKIISSAGPLLIFKIFLGSRNGFLGMLGDSSQLLVRQSFSQEYELEADSVGWQYLVAARIDPRGLADMLRKLKAMEDTMRLRHPGFRAFSSHPPTEKRIRRLDAKWKKLKDKSGFIEL